MDLHLLLICWIAYFLKFTAQSPIKSGLFNEYVILNEDNFFVKEEDSETSRREVSISINAYGESFMIHMSETTEVFGEENGYYVGYAVSTGDQDLKEGDAFGVVNIEEGIFRGNFDLSDEKYYVEDPKKFISEDTHGIIGFLYRASDINTTYEYNDDGLKMDRIPSDISTRFGPDFIEPGPYCNMNIEVDYSLFKSLGETERAVKDFVFLNIMAANRIYRRADLRRVEDMPIEFVVKRLRIHTKYSCTDTPSDIRCDSEAPRTPKDFIESFSLTWSPHTQYCLSYLFSAHDFGATLGIAYVGGICEIESTPGGKNYNLGFITTANYRTQYQTELTLAHELGHSLGSSHDSAKDGCYTMGLSPRIGNNLMSPVAPTVEGRNSRKLSSCSKRDINSVIADMQHGIRRNCLKKNKASLIISYDDFDTLSESSIITPSIMFVFIQAYLINKL